MERCSGVRGLTLAFFADAAWFLFAPFLPPKSRVSSEDFAFMLQARPGSYVWLGAGDGTHRAAGHGAGPCMLHNGSYDFNDALLPVGATYWVELARRWLAR